MRVVEGGRSELGRRGRVREKMRGSFSDGTDFGERLFDLLETVFPGLRRPAENAKALGASWESVSTPFVHLEHGRPVSHVGVIGLPLILLGRTVTVGSIRAVATHPDYRRRGYYRAVMEEVLGYCEGRFETLVLTTEHPEYFEAFGFRRVREHLFRVQCAGTGGTDGFRPIDGRDPADVRLLHRLLETREPVSDVVGVVKEKAIFCFNEGRRPLRYSQDLDAVVCLEIQGTRLDLFDVVGPALPGLAQVLERIRQPLTEVNIHFGADRLAPEAHALPRVFDHDGPSYLMVRGPFAAETHRFSLPRSART